ncbi:ECs_2282 family putative zinc-binding protein [Hyphomonas atlantica corrig.]|uniref:ECs_2282 family putative zinc-binding protein n=1 Tax=Hyphomonas atlantica TaxID=1280948 RepID=UPI0023552E44|nr:hypothetical protein [Hyphomonas atlantica]
MDAERYNRSISLFCPTCGNDQFQYDDENELAPVTCQQCKTEVSREDLIEANAENIEINKDEIIGELQKDVQKQFKDMFKGSKWKVR